MKPMNVEYLMMDVSILLPPTGTPLTGIDFVKRLPCGDVEKTRRVSEHRTWPLLGSCLFGPLTEQGRKVSDQVKSPPSHVTAGSRETDNTSHTLPRGGTPQSMLPSAKAGIEIPLHLAPDVGFGQAASPELWERKPGAGSVKHRGK